MDAPRRLEWIVFLTAASFAMSVIALVATFWHDTDRDRKAAALRACETYSSGDAMRKLADDIFATTTHMNADKTAMVRQDYSPAEKADTSPEGTLLKHRLLVWLNYLDVVATGLDNDLYDKKIISGCFGDYFDHASRKLIQPEGSIFKNADFSRIVHWSAKLKEFGAAN
jgi:hypothetical protein